MGIHEKLLDEAREERGVQAGNAARDEGISRADQHAPEDWKTAARKAVKVEALRHVEDGFTTDDVWLALEEAGVTGPHEPRALGAVMRKLSNEGKIRPTDEHRQSVRVKAHRNPKRVWFLVEGAA